MVSICLYISLFLKFLFAIFLLYWNFMVIMLCNFGWRNLLCFFVCCWRFFKDRHLADIARHQTIDSNIHTYTSSFMSRISNGDWYLYWKHCRGAILTHFPPSILHSTMIFAQIFVGVFLLCLVELSWGKGRGPTCYGGCELASYMYLSNTNQKVILLKENCLMMIVFVVKLWMLFIIHFRCSVKRIWCGFGTNSFS